MSMDSSKSSKFTFQSSVHSSHVLQCLNEQRKRDVLCDVTVVAENQSFRAHRAVLVSCSEYLSSRVPGHTAQGVVINLPDEVTADGFDALLEFAYTSKLIFTKENVLEIRNCASVLGFKNLDTACFDFLLPKFFNSSRSASKVQRKQCCKTKCCKSRGAELSSINKEDVIDDDKLLLQPSQFQFKEKEPSCPPSALTEDATGSCQNAKGEKQTDYSSLCPKYRKFQIACGKERPCLDACSSEAAPMSPEKIDDGCPLNYLPCSSNTEMVSACRTPPIIGKEHTFLSQCCPLMNSPSFHTPCGPCMDQLSLPSCSESTESICASTEKEMPPCSGVNGNERAFKCDGNRELRDGNEIFSPDQNNMSKSEQRSREEIEVARQLTFWPDTCPSWASSSNQGLVDTLSNLKCRQSSTLDPRAVECPFLKELDAMGAQMHDGEGSTSQGSPYVPSNQSGEDSDSFDTEGDSESYSSERMCAMALPFSVEQIVSLSRNDFQQMLKQQCLTREQLDVVHDIRRRSKNRIAARRCRKRKLDCIHNLECEIEKLRSEREKLTAERIQLNQMKLKAWQSYSGLYEKVCAEAALRPEQLQVLAKYSSPDCPISAFLCPSPDLSQSPETQPQSSGLPLGFSPCVSTHTCCSEARPSAGSLLDNTVGLAKSSSQNPLPAGNVEARLYTSPNDTTPSEKSGC